MEGNGISKRKLIVGGTILFVLAAAMVAFGLWMRQMMPVPMWSGRDTEIYSFDYLKHADLLSDWHFIGYGRFRHPLFSWLMAPVPLFADRFLRFGETPYWAFLCAVFTAFVLGSAVLLYGLLRRRLGLGVGEAGVCTALYLSFAHVWLLAGCPETYALSLLLFVAVVWWALREPDGDAKGRRLDWGVWIALAVLAGGVTLTQGVKACVAWVVARRPSLKRIVQGGLALAGCVCLVALIFYVRLVIRVHFDPGARGLDGAWQELFGPLTGYAGTAAIWLHHAVVFFTEPLIVRGEPFDVRVIAGGYCSWVQPLLLLALWTLVAVGAWRTRRTLLVRVLGAMFLVDVCIHFVLGWGMAESHLYGAHWFASVPLVLGAFVASCRGRVKTTLLVVLSVLAIGFAVCNVHGYFGHDVGLEWPAQGASEDS